MLKILLTLPYQSFHSIISLGGCGVIKPFYVGYNFCAIGFFNEADTLESSSILIYLKSWASLYTELGWRKAALIKWQSQAQVNESGLKVRVAEKVRKLITKFYANINYTV